MSNSSGRTSGSSGSPGDGGKTCTDCHAGGNFSASLQITDDIPAGGYELNTDYNITVTNTSTASKHGFQVTAEKTSNDSKVGIFTAGTGSQAFSNDNYLTHTKKPSTILSPKAKDQSYSVTKLILNLYQHALN